MPQGDKSKYTDKQKRQAEHIEEGYEKRGTSKKTAESRAWATVNAESGGGKKSGAGRAKKTATPKRKTAKRAATKRASPKRTTTTKRTTAKRRSSASK
jgi:plasmid stabilization system protein ParE